MQFCFKVHNTALALALVLAFAGCRNDGAGPVVGNQQAPDQVSPGNGAGNSASGGSGGSGGSSAAPQANAGHIAGSNAGGSGTAGTTAAGTTAAGITAAGTKDKQPTPPPRGAPGPTY